MEGSYIDKFGIVGDLVNIGHYGLNDSTAFLLRRPHQLVPGYCVPNVHYKARNEIHEALLFRRIQ
jgi:hypothetical protein